MDPQEKGRQQVARNREENEETRKLLSTAFALARSLSIKTLVVQADENRDVRLATKLREDERLIWFVRRQEKLAVPKPAKDVVLPVPDAALSRLSELNLALFLAALKGHIKLDERVLGLCGVTGSKRLNTLLIANPARDFTWLQHHKRERAMTRHLARVLEIALRLAQEGSGVVQSIPSPRLTKATPSA